MDPFPLNSTRACETDPLNFPAGLLTYVVRLHLTGTLSVLQRVQALTSHRASEDIEHLFTPFVATRHDDPELLDWLHEDGDAVTVTYHALKHGLVQVTAELDLSSEVQVHLSHQQVCSLVDEGRVSRFEAHDMPQDERVKPVLLARFGAHYEVIDGATRLWLARQHGGGLMARVLSPDE